MEKSEERKENSEKNKKKKPLVWEIWWLVKGGDARINTSISKKVFNKIAFRPTGEKLPFLFSLLSYLLSGKVA